MLPLPTYLLALALSLSFILSSPSHPPPIYLSYTTQLSSSPLLCTPFVIVFFDSSLGISNTTPPFLAPPPNGGILCCQRPRRCSLPTAQTTERPSAPRSPRSKTAMSLTMPRIGLSAAWLSFSAGSCLTLCFCVPLTTAAGASEAEGEGEEEGKAWPSMPTASRRRLSALRRQIRTQPSQLPLRIRSV